MVTEAVPLVATTSLPFLAVGERSRLISLEVGTSGGAVAVDVVGSSDVGFVGAVLVVLPRERVSLSPP